MGLSSFPSAGEGVLPVLVLLMVLLNSLLKSAIRMTTTTWSWASSTATGNQLVVVVDEITTSATGSGGAAGRRVSISHFKGLQSACVEQSSVSGGGCRAEDECSVCLREYEDGEEVSELGCSHLFHTSCLDKWFHNRHSTCPLCRSIL